MARVKWRRAGLLLAAAALLIAVFGLNALAAWAWPPRPAWLVGLIAIDVAAFVAIFALFHSALDPPAKGLPRPDRFKRNNR